MKTLYLSLLALLLNGCWALGDVMVQRRFDRAVPYGTPVRAGALSATTPEDKLLIENRNDSIILTTAVFAHRYHARAGDLTYFSNALEASKVGATLSRTYHIQVRGVSTVVHLVRRDLKHRVALEYSCHLRGRGEGVVASYSCSYGDTAFLGEAWWDKVPKPFARFIESLDQR